MKYKYIILKKEDKVLKIYLNRPEKMNALCNEMLNELNEIALNVYKDKSLNAIFFIGKEEFFSTGADLTELKNLKSTQALERSKFVQDTFKYFSRAEMPVISFLSGYTYGGGFELALHTDMRICANNVKFCLPEAKYNIIPGGGATVILPQIIGQNNALYYMITGKIIDAQEALRLSLIQEIVDIQDFNKCIDEYSKYFNNLNFDVINSLKNRMRFQHEIHDIEYTAETKEFAKHIENNQIINLK